MTFKLTCPDINNLVDYGLSILYCQFFILSDLGNKATSTLYMVCRGAFLCLHPKRTSFLEITSEIDSNQCNKSPSMVVLACTYGEGMVMLKESIKTISQAIFTIFVVLSLSGCFLDGGGDSTTIDSVTPITTANPAGGLYSAALQVSLTANEAATIYYSTDGNDPYVGGGNTTSGTSPISSITIPIGTTVLNFFAIDQANNNEVIKTETYVVGVRAFDFTVLGNEMYAAKMAKFPMTLFPAFTQLGHEILSVLENADPNNSPFELAMCMNAPTGSATVTWLDKDGDLELSTGDDANLTVINCDTDNDGTLISADIAITFTNVDVDNLPRIKEMDASMSFTITHISGPISFTGSFAVSNQTLDDINYTNTFIASDTPGQILAISQNNAPLYRFGCFNVVHSFGIAVPDTYDLATAGVINVATYIMSLEKDPPITFINNAPFSGTQRLRSQSVPYCAAVDVPNGVSDSNGAYIDIEAKIDGDRDILIKVFLVNDTLLWSVPFWWDLL